MSYPAHPKSKQVGVPPTYQQTRHTSAPRHQQYRSQHPQPRDNRYQNLNQPPRHPSPIPNQPQPSASPNTVPPQPPTALGTGTHDMNKQGAPNRPALTPSPVQQGTILSGPGQGIIINPQQIMYQQNMPRGQAPQQTMYMPIQANQRQNPRGGYPTSNMSQTQQGGQPQPTFQPSHQQMTMAAPPFIPSSHHTQQQPGQYMTIPQMMMQQTNVYAPRQPVHQLQYQPTAVFQQPNTPPFYQGSPPVSAATGAFFPQNQIVAATQQPQLRAQAPTMTIQQTQPRPAPKERKIIRIVDPSTNSDITDSIMREGGSSTGSTPTQSGRSSASSTPPASGPPPPTQPNQLNDKARAIQANFAAQVAAVAAAPADATKPTPVMNQTNNSQQPIIQQMVPPPQPSYHVPVAVPPPVQPQVTAVPPPQKEIPQATNQPAVVVDDSGVKVPIAIATEVQKQPSLPIRPSEVATAPTNQVMSHVGPIPAPVPAKISSVHNEEVTESKPMPSEAKSNSVPEKSTESVSNKDNSETSKEEVSSAPVTISAEKRDSKLETDSKVSKADASTKKEPVTGEKVSTVDTPKVDSRPDETAKQESDKKPLPQEKTEEKSSSVTIKPQTQKKESSEEGKQQAPAKESKKKANQKKRLAELDKKETKADDLEAFKDPEPSESTPQVTPATEDKKQEIKEKEEITTNLTSDKIKQEKQPVPEKEAPVVTEEETKPLTKSETKEETKPDVESEKLSEEKDVPKVEVDVVDSVDKKEREKVEAENAKNKESMDNEDDSNNMKSDLKDNKIQLKYTYREDQWSPVNPEGKKTYGRDFLLQFQPECKDKPDGLPHIPDIVLDKADIRPIAGTADLRLQQPGGGRSRGGGGNSDFLPDFMRMSPRGNQAPPQFPKVGGGRRSSREPKVIKRDEKVTEAVLKKSENAWKPDSKRADKAKPMGEEEAKSAELNKTFKSILNKLTPQNFQTLMTQTLALPIDNEERLISVIDLVFEKAITESAFSKAYANMCRVLSQIKVPSKTQPGLVQFRTVLINRCQKAFQADKTDEAKFEEMKQEIEKLEKGTKARNLLEDDLFIAQSKSKTKLLGYMRFIGELFKLKMLTETIMHDCIFKLLRAKDDESLECMSQLMTTVGKDLDHERAKNRIDQYFTQIGKITRNKAVSARIRFMLQDVEDLRKNNWIPRRDNNNPKTIAQIHKEAKQEEQQKNIESQMIVHSSRSKEKSSRGRPGPPPGMDSDWQTVSVNKARPQVDPSKLINLSKNRPDNDNVQLGPGGRPGAFGSWGRGSSGGGAKTQSSESVDLRPANRYAMLSDHQGRGGSSRPSGMAPPTRDSKGRPTANMPPSARRSRERDEGGRGSSREDSQKRERRQLLDEVSRTMGGNRSSRSIEKERLPERDRGSARGSRDGGSRDRGSRDRGSRDRGSRDRGSRDRGSWEKAPERKAAKSPVSSLTDEDIETKGRATLDEYLNIRDMKEACQCIEELNSPDRLHLFVRLSIEHTLELTTKKRLLTGELFSRLIAEKILSVQQYLKGLSEIVEFADDMAIDIPLIWQYLGELMGSMIQDKSQSIDFLKEALDPLKEAGKAGLLLAEIMKTAEQFIGADGMNELWHASGLKWEQFLPSSENVAEFVKEKKLEYTLAAPQTLKGDPIALMEKSLFIASGTSVNEVFDWIEKHIDPEKTKSREFIRALVTIVCQSTITSVSNTTSGESATIRCDPDLLKVRAKCLLRYIDGDVDKELQALYAVQALNHKLVNPPGLLRIIFDVLYDEDVISEDTFYAWQNSTDPAETSGKGVALKSVTSFFAWLGEAEDDTAN